MEWIKTSDRLPERSQESYSQVSCLVNKRYKFMRNGEFIKYTYNVEILVFNHEHECWDNEDGDDYNCDIEQVTHWMAFPKSPNQ